MKTDIIHRNDIETIISTFYESVKSDDLMSIFFSNVVAVNWEKHIPLMCSFWENVLFYTGEYEGDPLAVHRNINQIHPTSPEHFERWLLLFTKTVDKLYTGKNAEKMKKHARGIAAVMQGRVNQG